MMTCTVGHTSVLVQEFYLEYGSFIFRDRTLGHAGGG